MMGPVAVQTCGKLGCPCCTERRAQWLDRYVGYTGASGVEIDTARRSAQRGLSEGFDGLKAPTGLGNHGGDREAK